MRLHEIQKRLGQHRVRLVRLQRQAARMLREIAERRNCADEPELHRQAV